MDYIIQIKESDVEDFGYVHEEYFKGISIDEYGHIRLSFTMDPENAKRFAYIDLKAKDSIFRYIKENLHHQEAKIMKITVTLEEEKYK
jgi:5-bromo-4-chloroindolyl phosphate hydrolysis protein